MIAMTCPHCGHHLEISDKFAGVQGRCQNCRKLVTPPGGNDEDQVESWIPVPSATTAPAPACSRPSPLFLLCLAAFALAILAGAYLGYAGGARLHATTVQPSPRSYDQPNPLEEAAQIEDDLRGLARTGFPVVSYSPPPAYSVEIHYYMPGSEIISPEEQMERALSWGERAWKGWRQDPLEAFEIHCSLHLTRVDATRGGDPIADFHWKKVWEESPDTLTEHLQNGIRVWDPRCKGTIDPCMHAFALPE
jgi:hypothetical protein